LRDVFSQLTIEHVLEKVVLADSFFRRLLRSKGSLDPPRIAVAALNPHAGEQGRFGDEESLVIGPAVQRAKALGIDATGPLPVDTLMAGAADGGFDAVVAMYHDQGHIALKLLDMFEAVNITLGLPIVRTSVAHGTAHDIAWQGKATFGGMTQAILVASQLTRG
jgi:4-hydroxythreonine-4-phosphate dehydrogenase